MAIPVAVPRTVQMERRPKTTAGAVAGVMVSPVKTKIMAPLILLQTQTVLQPVHQLGTRSEAQVL